ncbi:MAG: hypothetical protein KGM24_03920 [Elusimicrobia bacterium]|nr:hypothetical protein [Elusimicrobiota bacterium]
MKRRISSVASIAALTVLLLCGWEAFWLARGRAALARSAADVHARRAADLAADAAEADEAAARLIPALPSLRASAAFLRRSASVDLAAAQMLEVERLLADKDSSALPRAKELLARTQELNGPRSPATAQAWMLLSRAYAQQDDAASAADARRRAADAAAPR